MLIKLKQAVNFKDVKIPVNHVYLFGVQDANGVIRLHALDHDKKEHTIDAQVFCEQDPNEGLLPGNTSEGQDD